MYTVIAVAEAVKKGRPEVGGAKKVGREGGLKTVGTSLNFCKSANHIQVQVDMVTHW